MEEVTPVCGFKDSKGIFHETEAKAKVANLAILLHSKFYYSNYVFNIANKFSVLDMRVVIESLVENSEALYLLNTMREEYLNKLKNEG